MWGSLQKVFNLGQIALKLRSLKHNLITSNIANVDTPGYRRQDIPFDKVMQSYLTQEKMLNTTHPKHRPFRTRDLREPLSTYQPKDLGTPNNVSVEEEMTAMVENQLLYEATVQALVKELERLKEIISEGGK
jgi:flagellar basal-body rod protein FlgB